MSGSSDKVVSNAIDASVNETDEAWVQSVTELPTVSPRGTATQNNGTNTRAE